jgi:hypothetical protein
MRTFCSRVRACIRVRNYKRGLEELRFGTARSRRADLRYLTGEALALVLKAQASTWVAGARLGRGGVL